LSKDQADVLTRIIAAVPEALLAAELARRDEARCLDRPPPVAPNPTPPAAPQSHTVTEWCANRRMSRSKLYSLWRNGEGPKFYRAGRAIRISDEADREWIAQSEAAA